MYDSITLTAAFVAGILSFGLPCTLVLVPIVMTHLTGVGSSTLDIGQLKRPQPSVVLHFVTFALGFTIVFVLLGASLGYLSKFASAGEEWISRIGGSMIIIFGLISMGLLKNPFYSLGRFLPIIPVGATGYAGSFLIGSAIAVGWIPCVGPILASILVLATTEASMSQGSLLLLLYALGLMTPFIGLSLVTALAMSWVREHRVWLRYTGSVAGVLLIVLGVMVFTNNFKDVAGYLFLWPF